VAKVEMQNFMAYINHCTAHVDHAGTVPKSIHLKKSISPYFNFTPEWQSVFTKYSKSSVNHIFAFFLAGSTLLLYIATRFPLNQSDTFFFRFGHFKESNYPADKETS